MEFSDPDLLTVFQALCLAERYYKDPGRKVEGMHPPSDETVAKRLADLEPVIERIMVAFETLARVR